MSLSSSLSNAFSGMNAASRAAEVVASNVSNSLTDGYGRRSLDLSTSVTGGRSAGVNVGAIHRHVDQGVLADRRLAESSLSGFETLVSTMGRVEDAVGRIGDGGSISARIVSVEAALIDAAADPSSISRLSAVTDRLTDLTDGLNAASKDIQALRVETDTSIFAQVEQLNTALSQVERLNVDIASSRNTGTDPSGLMDQRQKVIDQIARIVPIRELPRDAGQVALMTPNGETLLDGKAKRFEFVANAVIVPDMTLGSGALSGITLDGNLIAPDGLGKLAGGTLGAAFQTRDSELVVAQEGLDQIAADLISRFQNLAIDPTVISGQPGLLTDQGAAFDPVNNIGLSGRISLNINVDPTQGGTITKLRDGLNATTVGPSGNASLLQSLSATLAEPNAVVSDPALQSAAGRAAKFEAATGNQRLNFEAELSFSSARWSSLREAETADGVDTDYEMQMLLRVEQAYAANARVIQVVDSLMQRLMEI